MIKWGKCPYYVLDAFLGKDQICVVAWTQFSAP